MHLTEILTPRRIKVPLAATQKDAAIAELVDVLAAGGDIADRDKVLEAVMERERTRTTGIGSGLALPHGKSVGAAELVMAVGRPAEPIDFESIDGKPVSLVVLLVSPPDKTAAHIQALAKISRLLSIDSFRKKLNDLSTPQEIFDALRQEEQTA